MLDFEKIGDLPAELCFAYAERKMIALQAQNPEDLNEEVPLSDMGQMVHRERIQKGGLKNG